METDPNRSSIISTDTNSQTKCFAKQSNPSTTAQTNSPPRVELHRPPMAHEEMVTGFPHLSSFDSAAPTYLTAPPNHQFPYAYSTPAIMSAPFEDIRTQNYKYHQSHYNAYGGYLSAHARPSPYPSKPNKLHHSQAQNTNSAYSEYNDPLSTYPNVFDGR